MLDQADFLTRSVDGLFVVEINGDVDCRNAYRLSAVLEEAAGQPHNVLISLEHALYFDSRTLGMLWFFSRRLRESGRRAMVAIPPRKPMRKLCASFGVFKMMDVFDSVDEALATEQQAGERSLSPA